MLNHPWLHFQPHWVELCLACPFSGLIRCTTSKLEYTPVFRRSLTMWVNISTTSRINWHCLRWRSFVEMAAIVFLVGQSSSDKWVLASSFAVKACCFCFGYLRYSSTLLTWFLNILLFCGSSTFQSSSTALASSSPNTFKPCFSANAQNPAACKHASHLSQFKHHTGIQWALQCSCMQVSTSTHQCLANLSWVLMMMLCWTYH